MPYLHLLMENDTVLPGSTGRLAEPMLYVAVRGEFRITVNGADLAVAAGDALWVPAGSTAKVAAEASAVVLPVPGHVSGPSVVAEVVDAIAHLPILLEGFSRALGHLDDGAACGVIVRLTEATILAPPPAPVSAELHDLADLLTDNPELDLSAAVNAAVTGWSIRSVQRHFRTETGHSLNAWARRARIHAAAELLRDGRDIEWVAHRVGFQSVPGFVRAFREIAGSTPGQWRSAAAGAELPSARLKPAVAPSKTLTWERVNGAHVAVWAALGDVDVAVGGRSMRVREGEAVVLPAGIRNQVAVPAGSLMLPIGYRSGRSGAFGLPVAPVRIAPRLDTEVIAWMVEAYTRAEPDLSSARAAATRGFEAVLCAGPRTPIDEDGHRLTALASAVSLHPGRSFTDIAVMLGADEIELRRIIRELTGESSSTWLRAARMTRARNLLNERQTASRVSRDLGYSHLPAFSRAFREVHGAGPTRVPLTDISMTRASLGM